MREQGNREDCRVGTRKCKAKKGEDGGDSQISIHRVLTRPSIHQLLVEVEKPIRRLHISLFFPFLGFQVASGDITHTRPIWLGKKFREKGKFPEVGRAALAQASDRLEWTRADQGHEIFEQLPVFGQIWEK